MDDGRYCEDLVMNNERAGKFIEFLGGRESLRSVDACITRLRLTVNASTTHEHGLKQVGA
ncbi:hypothetical protein ACH42_15950 [Endozoicomonas sp. (ex Bugula neritina AB1)]|nr:hypothetical protein ACH42_15950 [Endozoicomonas sp. (ex Bugula neritina AB1)]